MSGMNVLKVGPDRIIGSRDMGVSEVAPGKRSCPGLRYLYLAAKLKLVVVKFKFVTFQIYHFYVDFQILE